MTLGTIPAAYQEQWNFTLQHQLPRGVAVEAAYAGSHGVHLPSGSVPLNALPPQYVSLGNNLNNAVPNPFYGFW